MCLFSLPNDANRAASLNEGRRRISGSSANNLKRAIPIRHMFFRRTPKKRKLSRHVGGSVGKEKKKKEEVVVMMGGFPYESSSKRWRRLRRHHADDGPLNGKSNMKTIQ